MPAPVAAVAPPQLNTTVHWDNAGCHAGVSAAVVVGAAGAHVTFTGASPADPLCSDFLLVATNYGLTPVALSPLDGSTATADVPLTDPALALDVQLNGLGLFIMPCGFLGSLASLLATVALFDAPTDAELAANNAAWLRATGVWTPSVKPFNRSVTIDPSSLRSGDYLAIGKLDGLDPMIEWAIGGVTGHSAMVVRDPQGAPWVVESTDADPFGTHYWPPPYGVIRTPWERWVAQARAAAYHVSVLPLAAPLAAAFDLSAFWSWFASVEGMSYGYQTMLFAFMDVGPESANLPQPIVARSVTAVLNMAEASGLLQNASAGISVFNMITWGANKRLGTSCGTLACLIGVANANVQRGAGPRNLVDIMAIPDDDSWTFGGNTSMVCSQLTAHGLKVALGAAVPAYATIVAAEQSPKDNYQAAVYDPQRFTDANCPGGVMAGGYCQLMGAFTQLLNGYNSIPLYAGMNNHCPSQWPGYVRCPPGNATCC